MLGSAAAPNTPIIKQILDGGVNVSAGTDPTCVASYNPCVSLSWQISEKIVGSMQIYEQDNLLDCKAPLPMCTKKVAWSTNEVDQSGQLQ